MFNKKILYCSLSLILGGSLFVIHDAIINHLTEIEFKFYHHVFFGSPWLILIFIYLYFTRNIKTYLGSSNYSILILRGFLFLPLPYMLFISLQNITLPEWTTLNMISPILGSILAILFLGEKINYFTTTAIFFWIYWCYIYYTTRFSIFQLLLFISHLWCIYFSLAEFFSK